MTYGELERRANALAAYLASSRVAAEVARRHLPAALLRT
jgi:hypothetical protein